MNNFSYFQTKKNLKIFKIEKEKEIGGLFFHFVGRFYKTFNGGEFVCLTLSETSVQVSHLWVCSGVCPNTKDPSTPHFTFACKY